MAHTRRRRVADRGAGSAGPAYRRRCLLVPVSSCRAQNSARHRRSRSSPDAARRYAGLRATTVCRRGGDSLGRCGGRVCADWSPARVPHVRAIVRRPRHREPDPGRSRGRRGGCGTRPAERGSDHIDRLTPRGFALPPGVCPSKGTRARDGTRRQGSRSHRPRSGSCATCRAHSQGHETLAWRRVREWDGSALRVTRRGRAPFPGRRPVCCGSWQLTAKPGAGRLRSDPSREAHRLAGVATGGCRAITKRQRTPRMNQRQPQRAAVT